MRALCDTKETELINGQTIKRKTPFLFPLNVIFLFIEQKLPLSSTI